MNLPGIVCVQGCMDDYEQDLETCRLHGWTLDELEEARAVHDAWWATRNDPENWQKMWPDRPMPYVICEAELVIPLTSRILRDQTHRPKGQ